MLQVLSRAARSNSAWCFLGLLLSLLLIPSIAAIAHPGHGNEFEDSGTAATAESIQVDETTAERLGIEVEVVEPQRLAVGIETTGQVEALPNQQAKVTAPVGGTVVRLLVEPGDRVRAGQAVALMTSPDLASLRTEALDRRTDAVGSVQSAEADLRLAQQTYARQQQIAAAEIQEAQAAFNLAQERHDRNRELAAQGAIPQQQVMESEAERATARAALTSAQSRLSVSEAAAALERARSQVQVAQSRLQLSDDAYQTRLRQLGVQPHSDGLITIVAPIAGTVAEPMITAGESIDAAGAVLMTLLDGQGVWATANVFEKDLPKISMGQSVRVRVAGSDKTFTGNIAFIGSTVQGDSRVVPVRAELNNPNGILKPGMFAELELLTGQTSDRVLSLPATAIVDANGRKLVYVQNGQNFEPTDVELGRTDGDRVEIKSGLFEGDRVVIQGAPMLYAQSLRGGSANAEADHSEPAPAATVQASSASGAAIPWWAMGLGGGAIALSTFAAGMALATHRSRKTIALSAAALQTASHSNGSTPRLSEQTGDAASSQRPHL
ncbi:efflux RND transporter periplasmic adaptor subunit [Microcoleus sp. FACHB-1515]|uniref:efflux RND transporter periplasmic adaptor subunit n=1 Tax=Cyanophyceae TaxID=3028117 RepID=UPI0016878F07|nr:efflux RND transporter periplasmic adaptor subunit [Microcoleus sp. FACHB-1515]MBD2093293.1 efflux RND transporter periplasmic adaptor subunit [Microcoleus sp. FACHB-1515]